MRVKFSEKMDDTLNKKSDNATFMTREKYNEVVRRVKELQEPVSAKTNKDYSYLRKYDLLMVTVDNSIVWKLRKKGTDKIFVHADEVFDIINSIHLARGHGGRDIMEKEVGEKYANITREYIMIYIRLCETCQLKKSSVRKSLVVKPIISKHMNSRCQVDLIDMQSQPDGSYKFILNYQDHLTKMVVLRPLRSKTAEEVAYQLVDIFCDKGAPSILQSDNGREFANKLVQNVLELWPNCRLVHGKPRHSQSQGSVERANRDVEAILACWQKDNNCTKWSEGLRFVQWQKNTRHHSGIGRSPYEAFYGQKPQLGVAAYNLPEEAQSNLLTEEQLEEAFDATSNIPAEKAFEEPAAQGVSRESQCKGACSADCTLCSRQLYIDSQREASKQAQERQAEKMKSASVRRFKPAEVGDTVMVPIPLVDRGRAEFPNAKAVIISKVDGGLYQLGTHHGLLKQQYTRNQFSPCDEQFMKAEDVPRDKEVGLREVANAEAMGSGQGCLKCLCKGGCNGKRCKCRKNGRVCNSRCSCTNCCNK